MQNNPMAPRPPPPTTLSQLPPWPQNPERAVVHCQPTDKIRKRGAEEFLGLYHDDVAKVEHWLVNT